MDTRAPRPLLTLCALGAISLSVQSPAWGRVAPDDIPAVWKEQEIQFHYTQSGGVHSCNALQRKLRAILTELGATQPLSIRVQSCVDGYRHTSPDLAPRPDAAPRVTLRIRSLVQDTHEARAELAARRGHEELKARVRNQGGLDANYGTAVAAEWKQVRLSPRSGYLDRTDCELVRQLQAQVFARMAVRVVKDSGTCNRESSSLRLAQPSLNVEALVPSG